MCYTVNYLLESGALHVKEVLYCKLFAWFRCCTGGPYGRVFMGLHYVCSIIFA